LYLSRRFRRRRGFPFVGCGSTRWGIGRRRSLLVWAEFRMDKLKQSSSSSSVS